MTSLDPFEVAKTNAVSRIAGLLDKTPAEIEEMVSTLSEKIKKALDTAPSDKLE